MSEIIKKLFIAATVLAAAACTGRTQDPSETVRMKFNEDGTFKILQVTDVHVDWDCPEEYEKVYNQLCDMLDSGRPDLAVLTGDIVTESAGGETPWEKYLVPFDERKVPFVLTFGNHDRENVLMDTRMAELVKAHPSCANILKDGYIDDNAVEIMSSDGSKVAAVVYVMDSGDYSVIPGIGNYGWIAPSQMRWYDQLSKAYRKANAGCPVPSYMFMHIPFNEFNEAWETGCEIGDRGERECPGTLNSGMLALIKANADVHGVFVGHDHDNDYVADAYGVGMVYGRFSGGATTSTHSKTGMRFIELKQGDYGFHTWVRERNGDITMDHCYNPGIDYSLHKACKAEGRQNGALLGWYDGAESLEAMYGMDVEKEIVPMPRHECRHFDGPHGFSYESFIYIPETGLWRFRTGERRNGCIKIDDVVLATDYDTNVTDINLEKGFHKLDAKAWVKGPRSDFKLTWMPPSSDRLRDVPEEYFFVK